MRHRLRVFFYYARILRPWLLLVMLGVAWALNALVARAPTGGGVQPPVMVSTEVTLTAALTTAAIPVVTPLAVQPPVEMQAGAREELAALISEVVALTNQARRENGCDVMLTSSPLLDLAAQRHSEDMARRGYFDHVSPDGAKPGDRISATGYRWSRYGENIAAGHASPAQVVKGWMQSPGHRANLLDCAFREIGVGYSAEGEQATVRSTLWTQVFATP